MNEYEWILIGGGIAFIGLIAFDLFVEFMSGK